MSDQRCCCPSLDPYSCIEIRYNVEQTDEPCECSCHEDSDDSDAGFPLPEDFPDDGGEDFSEEDVVT